MTNIMLQNDAPKKLKKTDKNFSRILFDTLRTFSIIELKRFGWFISSRGNNGRKELVTLYYSIRKLHPFYRIDRKEEINIYKKIYPDLEYKETTMRILMHLLCQLAYDFLAIENLKKKQIIKDECLREEFLKRDLLSHAEKKLHADINFLYGRKEIDKEHFLDLFFLETDRFNILSKTTRVKRARKLLGEKDALAKRGYSLVSYFALGLINEKDNLNKLMRNIGDDISIEPLEEIVSCIKFDNLIAILKKINPKLAFIFDIYQSQVEVFSDTEDEEKYNKLKSLVLKYQHRLSKNEMQYLYIRLFDYNIQKRKQKGQMVKYDKELFSLYKNYIENRIYLGGYKERLQSALFRNILLVGLRLKKFDWIREQMLSKSIRLEQAKGRILRQYAEAEILFAEGNITESLSITKKIEKLSSEFKIDIRTLFLRTMYEMGANEELLVKAKNALDYLYSNKMIDSAHRRRHMNFTKALIKIARIRVNNKVHELRKLRYGIKIAKYIVFKEWLIEKADRLSIGRKAAV